MYNGLFIFVCLEICAASLKYFVNAFDISVLYAGRYCFSYAIETIPLIFAIHAVQKKLSYQRQLFLRGPLVISLSTVYDGDKRVVYFFPSCMPLSNIRDDKLAGSLDSEYVRCV